jgi:hypothetical protein
MFELVRCAPFSAPNHRAAIMRVIQVTRVAKHNRVLAICPL